MSTDTALDHAVNFLALHLAERHMAATQIQANAITSGISGATLRRAKHVLGVKSYRYRDHWRWEL